MTDPYPILVYILAGYPAHKMCAAEFRDVIQYTATELWRLMEQHPAHMAHLQAHGGPMSLCFTMIKCTMVYCITFLLDSSHMTVHTCRWLASHHTHQA